MNNDNDEKGGYNEKTFIIVGMILITTGLLGAFLSHQGSFSDEEIIEVIHSPDKAMMVEAETKNGSIDAYGLTLTDDVRLDTSNGSIDVRTD
ncbi:hypothetical protein SAMN05421839_10659 [Halolactibacillus halophilus]|uniref:Uncharacterized protein n=1 Tax=Halolactibacillus halophilus TaxID=306540 RepID=A0A1I5MQZ5_9BACI|nr:hypothetical protein [Halolactibacillus halophilus]GEM01231.1 hypothetical protein HHA03_07630 [Halolactibacillus halophilus]SFP11940.1 hypothetical protein SAMN05421839_10659 [Halolactibacillus halophilus]